MEHVISSIWVLLDLLSCFVFLSAFLLPRKDKIHQIGTFCLAWVVCSILVLMKLAGFGKQIWTFTVTIVASFLLYRGSLIKHILLITVAFVFNGVIDMAIGYGVCAILKISYSEFVWKKLLYITVATTAKLIEVFLAYLLFRIRQKEGRYRIRKKWLLLISLFPAVSLLILIVMFVLLQDQKNLSIGAFSLSAVLAVANVGVLYLIQMMEKRTKEEQQLILISQQAEIQTKNIMALEKSYRAQRRASHEFLHHMQTISDLLDRREYDEVRGYVHELRDTHTVRIFAVNTHHPILDVLLNQKYQFAADLNIQMDFTVNDLSSVILPTSELVVMLSNLLDNAIEACEKVTEEKIIRCTLVVSDSLYISIRNTSLPVMIINGNIETTKEPKLDHGFGLPTVCRILDILHAEYDFQYLDGWFHFAAEIPL